MFTVIVLPVPRSVETEAQTGAVKELAGNTVEIQAQGSSLNHYTTLSFWVG